jgi:hypothetical protein
MIFAFSSFESFALRKFFYENEMPIRKPPTKDVAE